MQPQKITAAIIGLGRIGSLLEDDPLRIKPHTHAGFYNAHPEINLIAACDIDSERQKTFQLRYPNSHTYSNYHDMLSSSPLELLSISAFTKDRPKMAIDAINAGVKGLWLEKPIASSLNEAHTLNKKIKHHQTIAIVDHRRRLVPQYLAVKRIINDKTFGKLRSVHVSMSGGLLHTGTHAYDVLDFLCGDWATIRGKTESFNKSEDASGFTWLTFHNGVEAFISAQKRNYYIFQFDFHFDSGRILLGNDICKVFSPSNSQNYSNILELTEDPQFTLYDHPGYTFLDDLIMSVKAPTRPVINSVENAITALEIGIGILQSSKENSALLTRKSLDHSLTIDTH